MPDPCCPVRASEAQEMDIALGGDTRRSETSAYATHTGLLQAICPLLCVTRIM